MIKKKLIVLLSMLFFIFLQGYYTNSLAYTFDEFIEYCQLIKEYTTNTNNRNAANWVLNNKTTIQNYVNNISNLSEYSTWYLYRLNASSSYNGNIGLIAQKKGTAWNWNNKIKSTPNTGWTIRSLGNATTWGVGSWQSIALENSNNSAWGDKTIYIGLIDKEQVIDLNIQFGNYEWNNFYEQWSTKYLEFNNEFIDNTAYNGSLFTYYYQGDFYNKSQILIGNIIPNDSYYFELTLKDSVTGISKGQQFTTIGQPIYNDSDSALYVDDDYNVYVNTRFLNYSTQYQLEIVSYYGNGGDNLQEDIDWFIFLPLNAVISGDYIMSLGSGDFDLQDSTNQIINNQNESQEKQTEDILGTLTEVPSVTSGDLVNNFEVVEEYDNSLVHNFFYDMLLNISEIFLQDEEVTLKVNLPIFNREINIRSDFWITRNYLGDEFYDFIQSAWWVLICYIMLVKVDLMIELFNFGDFIGAIGEIYQTRRLL